MERERTKAAIVSPAVVKRRLEVGGIAADVEEGRGGSLVPAHQQKLLLLLLHGPKCAELLLGLREATDGGEEGRVGFLVPARHHHRLPALESREPVKLTARLLLGGDEFGAGGGRR